MAGSSAQHSLDDPDDGALCDQVFCRIYNRHKRGIDLTVPERMATVNPMDADILTPEERAVVLAYDGLGIILNGGFEYLFGRIYPGDPDFVLMAASYHQIGCRSATRVFADAMALFPGKCPPRDRAQRMARFEAISTEVRESLNNRFFDTETDIIKCLAVYIRSHRTCFEPLA